MIMDGRKPSVLSKNAQSQIKKRKKKKNNKGDVRGNSTVVTRSSSVFLQSTFMAVSSAKGPEKTDNKNTNASANPANWKRSATDAIVKDMKETAVKKVLTPSKPTLPAAANAVWPWKVGENATTSLVSPPNSSNYFTPAMNAVAMISNIKTSAVKDVLHTPEPTFGPANAPGTSYSYTSAMVSVSMLRKQTFVGGSGSGVVGGNNANKVPGNPTQCDAGAFGTIAKKHALPPPEPMDWTPSNAVVSTKKRRREFVLPQPQQRMDCD